MAELNARIIPKASGTAGEVPLASDLETAELAVNTADGTLFTKDVGGAVVTISGGGGGGAVDSVNGETGVVSLGIQDMDDVQIQPVEYVFDTNSSPSNPNTAGEWYVQNPGVTNRLYWCRQDADGLSTTSIADLPSGSKVWFNRVEFTTAGASGGTANYYSVLIVEDLTPVVESGPDLEIAITRPLVDGDIVRWSQADQTFDYSPFEIQEASDFALNLAPFASYEFNLYASGNYPVSDYEWNIYSNELRLWDTAADGTDLTAIWPTLPASGTVWWSTDSLTFTASSYTSKTIMGNGYCRLIGVSPLPMDARFGPLFVRFSDPGPNPGIPLAEGDTLQWNATDQKFNPAELPLSVNGETGVVSLGIEDMDDFALNQSSNQVTAQWSIVDNNQIYSVDGEWYARYTTQLVVANADDSGTNQFSFLSGLSTMWVSQDGTNFTELTASSVTAYSAEATSIIFTTVHGITNSGYVIIANQDYGPQDVPLAEGDTLQWDDADQKFKPIEYFNVKAASYSDLVGGQSIDSTTATVITGCTNVVTENSIYSNTAGVITISEAGVYEIYGCVGATGNTADYRWTAEYDVRVDGSMVARQVGGYIRATSASFYSDIAINTIVPITAGQTVDFTLKRVSNVTGNATVLADTSRILIKKLS